MNLLLCYDVNTETLAGRCRLRRVAKICEAYGQRVQHSVFECTVSPPVLECLRQRILHEIDAQEDSMRFYHLGADREAVVEAYGRDRYVDFTAPLVV